MSIAIQKNIWKWGPQTPAHRTMLLALADHADDTGGSCYPGVELLAEKCGVVRRTVQRTLRTLERDGWIAIDTRGGRQSNRYQIVLSMLTKASHECRVRGDVGVAPGVTSVSPEPSVEPSKKTHTSSTNSGGMKVALNSLTEEEITLWLGILERSDSFNELAVQDGSDIRWRDYLVSEWEKGQEEK